MSAAASDAVSSPPPASSLCSWTAESPELCYIVDQPFLPEASAEDGCGELLVTMVGAKPVALKRRMPAAGTFSATFKAGAKTENCEIGEERWADVRRVLADVTTEARPTTLMEAAGCPKGTPLPVLWSIELLPDGNSGFNTGAERNATKRAFLSMSNDEKDRLSRQAQDKLNARKEFAHFDKRNECLFSAMGAGEFDLGCIGISTALHLAEPVAAAAIESAKKAKKAGR